MMVLLALMESLVLPDYVKEVSLPKLELPVMMRMLVPKMTLAILMDSVSEKFFNVRQQLTA